MPTRRTRGELFYLVISYFHNGIEDIHPSKDLDLHQLVKLIRNNPRKDLIEEIRILRLQGDETEYKRLKKQLPYITPNCKLRARSLKKNIDDLEKNLISFTQYLYIDIDVKSDVDEYKEYFITKYGHQALLVCKSCSGGGISVLFRITNSITVKNFEDIVSRNYKCTENGKLECTENGNNCAQLFCAFVISAYTPQGFQKIHTLSSTYIYPTYPDHNHRLPQ